MADLNPQIGTEAGKTRPVLIVQTNLLNKTNHPSTIVCPLTSNIKKDSEILRVHIKNGQTKLHQPCYVMIDQIRAIDNKRLMHKIDELPNNLRETLKKNIQIILDLE